MSETVNKSSLSEIEKNGGSNRYFTQRKGGRAMND